MSTTSLAHDVGLVCDLARTKVQDGHRAIVGIAGPPASGKSTLADSAVQELNKDCPTTWPLASLLPMDGYHLDNRILESRGLLARKGAPETFDAHGFCDAVTRLQDEKRETYYPKFDRQMDLAIANAIAIHPQTSVIVVEGNYLLLKSGVWSSLYDVFTATVFVNPPMKVLEDRLQQRWIKHGLEPKAATLRTRNNDLPNAELIVRESREADLHLDQNYKEFGIRYAY